MARSEAAMPESHERLSARIQALEDRVRRLEARLLRVRAAPPSAPSVKGGSRPAKGGKPGPSRPRCPGCTLELPRGPRAEACVWCGFLFEAVRRGRGTSQR